MREVYYIAELFEKKLSILLPHVTRGEGHIALNTFSSGVSRDVIRCVDNRI